MKIGELIKKITAYYPPLREDRGVDTVKFGDPDKECSGIAVTCCGTADVIRSAAAMGDNFLIVHEPLFWNYGSDDGPMAESGIYLAKKKLLSDAGIVVWRDHDLMHAMNFGGERTDVDGMFDGIMRELGWEPYLIESDLDPVLFKIPQTDATELGLWFKEKFGLNGIRIVGDPHTKVSKVFVCEHINTVDDEVLWKMIRTEREDFDALIPLETIDWTLPAFIRDCCQLGKSKVMYQMGHFNFEELGMRHLARILPGIIGEDVPVHFIQSGDSFDYIV